MHSRGIKELEPLLSSTVSQYIHREQLYYIMVTTLPGVFSAILRPSNKETNLLIEAAVSVSVLANCFREGAAEIETKPYCSELASSNNHSDGHQNIT